MKARPATDPTNWIYQANMHGATQCMNPPRPPVDPTEPRECLRAWNTCDHRAFFFLSWHRMYLYYFERILRQASGDPNLALPYWNYSDPLPPPGQRDPVPPPPNRFLTEPFRIPANASNPLWVRERGAGINQGTVRLEENDVDYRLAFDSNFQNFFHTTTTGTSFGGRRVSQTSHRGPGTEELEAQPHSQVHVVVGGSNGWMRQVESAARDPIFWLHHANTDRLWESWLQLRRGRANPTGNSDWMNDRFTFFDVGGGQVTLRGRDIINTVQQRNYRYDDGEAQSSRDEVQLGSSQG